MGWLNAAQALQLLGVRPQTLYAQVSRKNIRARPDPQDSRRSLYHEQDVLRQAERHSGRRRDEAVASAAMGWGDPVLHTSISTVVQGRLYYRGHEVVQLAQTATLEDIACLLWACDAAPPTVLPVASSTAAAARPITRALGALAARVASDPPSLGLSPQEQHAQAWSVLHSVADALLGQGHGEALHLHLHQRLARHWHSPQAAELLRQTLVLLADHELNASTFATRVSASTGAAFSACVLSGLATLSGPLHGGASSGILAMADASTRLGSAAVLQAHVQQGSLYPTFGHPLYPLGDVRAQLLLPQLQLPAGFAALQAEALRMTGEHPTIDFALAAMARSQGWPDDAPLTLYALSRCTGWLAHAMEQLATGSLIRPRARYVGAATATPAADVPQPTAAGRWHP